MINRQKKSMGVRVPTNTPASSLLSLASAPQPCPSDNVSATDKQVSSVTRKDVGKSFSGHMIICSPGTSSGVLSVMPDCDDVVCPKSITPSDQTIVARSVASADDPCRERRLLTAPASRPTTSANISLPIIREEGVHDAQSDMARKGAILALYGKYDFQSMRISLMRQHLHHALEPLLSLLADDKNENSVARHKADPLVVSVDMRAYEDGMLPSLGPHFASLLKYEADDPCYPYVSWSTDMAGYITVNNLLLLRSSMPTF